MSKIKVLFFAADPLSAPRFGQPRLMLDEDVRRIRKKVREAEYRDALDFDVRPAARTDDLIQALYETRPQVVHFSGHGGKDGLVLVGADGSSPQPVDAAGLTRLFTAFRGDIRVVVLNACFSIRQARAIADIVGCAIGTRVAISDEAAITFGASFYRAIAWGRSVQAAFEHACTALALEYPAEQDTPELVARPDVDPAQVVLVPRGSAAPAPSSPEAASPPRDVDAPPAPRRPRLAVRWAAVAAATLGLSAGAALARVNHPNPPHAPQTFGNFPGTARDLDSAKLFHAAGNHAAAFRLFERAAQAGNAEAMGFLGIAYLRGQGTARQPQLALYWLREAAGKRDARGMHALGMAYERGDGVKQSNRYALHWYRAAAVEKGYAPAMSSLAGLYLRGLGVPQSHDSALVWYRRAADAGYADAKVGLGMMLARGLAAPRDTAGAIRLFRAAADSGSARGMFALGWVYQEGVLTPQDYVQARAWYLKAAKAGYAGAMNNLGVLYHHGWGVRQDRRKSIRWFRRAADAGSAVAAGNLAALQPD